MARLEREIGNLRNQVEEIKDSYGSDHLKLVVTRGHLEALFQNDSVVRYLTQNHGEIFEELRKLIDSTTILSETTESAEMAPRLTFARPFRPSGRRETQRTARVSLWHVAPTGGYPGSTFAHAGQSDAGPSRSR